MKYKSFLYVLITRLVKTITEKKTLISIFNLLYIFFLFFIFSTEYCFGQSISMISETKISLTGSSIDITFSDTEVMDYNVLCATDVGLLLFDRTNPNYFQYKFHFEKTDNNFENNSSVVGYKDYCYFSSGDSIIHILKVINGESIQEIDNIDMTFPVQFMKIFGKKLFVSEQIDGGRELLIEVLDISNPESPEILFKQDIEMPWGGWLHPSLLNDLALYHDKLIVLARHISDSGGDFGKIIIYDISDIGNPQEIKIIELRSIKISYSSIAIKDNFAFIPTTYDTLTIYDLSESNFFQSVYKMSLEPYYAGYLEIFKNKLYISKYHTVTAYDIETPTKPTFLYSIYESFYGVILDLDFFENNIIVTLDKEGLWKYEITEEIKKNPVVPNSIALDIAINNNNAFLANKFAGVSSFDITNLNNPALLQIVNTNAYANQIEIYQNYLFVDDGWGGIDIFNIVQPDQMIQKEYDPDYSNIMSLLIYREFAYVSSYNIFGVLDITEPWAPVKIGEIQKYNLDKILFANDSLVFVDGFSYNCINVFNVSTPQQPEFICSVPLNGYGSRIGFDNYVYTTSEDSQLVVIDLKNPLNPIYYSTDGIQLENIIDAVLLEDTLFLSDGNLHVFSVADPIAPKLLSSYHTNYSIGMIDVKYPYIFSADKGYLRIYKYTPSTHVKTELYKNINTCYLKPCYPNPFNQSTRILFSISNLCKVTIKLYDILGREITTIVNEYKHSGDYSLIFNAENLANGIYILKFQAGGQTKLNKLLLIK